MRSLLGVMPARATAVRMEAQAWGVHAFSPGVSECSTSTSTLSSASAPTMTQYAAVFGIAATFLLAVLMLVGVV